MVEWICGLVIGSFVLALVAEGVLQWWGRPPPGRRK